MSKVLIGLTGSIACFKVAGLISDLVKDGHEVKCIASPSALRFVGSATLEGLSGNSVHTELFEQGQAMEHINLGRWADVFLIAPCTANTLAKLKVGLADDLLTTTALAFEKNKSVFIAPAMNKEMWSHSTTVESIKALEMRGYKIIEPESGSLACGETGDGRLAEIDSIKNALFLTRSKRVLITGGGTREPIDGVRFIGNASTGRTARSLEKELLHMGFEVDHLNAESSFHDFKESLKSQLENKSYDTVIHAAAVSDYSVDSLSLGQQKLKPDTSLKLQTGKSLSINLKVNPKLINSLKNWSQNPKVQVIGFKLTNTESEQERAEAVQKLFKDSAADYIVHNDLNDISETRHLFRIMQNDHVISTCDNSQSLAFELSKLIGGAP